MAPMRRKSQGSIRSPHVRRNVQSQVTFEDWLFKLEGGALKQWKQRWCVLVDFCLFFYKAPHEGKVVSSILLPSYKINPCSSNDKISKKYAFKAEHQNMKTYYFAAESRESMKKWMNVMSLATIMQNSGLADNHDDSSGFISYRSNLRSDSRSDSVHNRVSSSEPLKQRSNSCGDRVGEFYLGSDDKYPTLYKIPSSQPSRLPQTEQDIPVKQPLYANAPPKPRRLTQVDSFGMYAADCFNGRELAETFMDQSQCNIEFSADSSYVNNPPVQYLPTEMDAKNSAYMHPTSYIERDTMQSFSNFPGVYREKPPRPRSADFLERGENDYAFPPSTSQCYNENHHPQPQRPKSSLECYDHRVLDAEDCDDFDDYRNAVRIQADNFYANKNLIKSRGRLKSQRSSRTVTQSDPRLNVQYYDSHNLHSARDPVQSPFSQICSQDRYDDQHFRGRSNQQYGENYDFRQGSSLDSNKSMQRLLEWKQRMLQSPLSRQNHLHSVSSDISSSNSLKQADYGFRNLAPVDKQTSSSMQDRDVSHQNHEFQNVEHEFPSSKSCVHEPSQYCDVGDKVKTPYQSKDKYQLPETTGQSNKNVQLGEKTGNFNQNVMYCVDSENNEILFSYDVSPTDSNPPVTFCSSHYPPQMHSFSTLSNVNDVGIEPLSVREYSNSDVQKDSDDAYETNCSQLPGLNTVQNERQATYSSDDEASADSQGRHCRLPEKESSEDQCSTISALDIPTLEELHLKKLLQQSYGLMYKGKRLSVSAGDLLGKTHEELVLLLIQLRRNQSKILKAKGRIENKIRKDRDNDLQIESHQYEELCNQMVHLEKQYKVTQPLVTLVDNMVKLGSLYGSSNRRSFSLPILDSSQAASSSPFLNGSLHQVNTSKLLKKENHLQKHIEMMNSLERSLQNETNSVSSLHQDKEMLEHTLFGMRSKILDHQDRPAELQKLRKQQKMIEKELMRIKRLLSSSAKKIEDATSKNDQMEQEILYLRQILKQALKIGSTEMIASQPCRADLEAELSRLQSVLDELANHRHEINNTVEKLKGGEGSCSSHRGTEVRASPTGVAGSAPLPLRKKHHCMYLETDLDTMMTRDLAVSYEKDLEDMPVYANAKEITLSNDEEALQSVESMTSYSKQDMVDLDSCPLQDINEADERMKRFYGILPKEKPSEIKTVRIVKRQSERRNREKDKKKISYGEQSSVWIMEEPDLSSDDYLEVEERSTKKPPEASRPVSIPLTTTTTSNSQQTNAQSAHERLFGSNTPSKRRCVSMIHSSAQKLKRRHYTVSGYQYMLDPQFAQYFTERPRSRDDVDMERCLRTANTPDIVRSTIKKKDVFDEKLIERELGLPQKIDIPERYIEVEPEHLSATEKLRRSLKAENICKMLSETTTSYGDVMEKRTDSPEALHKKLNEEKRKRAQLLSLNQALAREVVERSKAVAANVCPLESQAAS